MLSSGNIAKCLQKPFMDNWWKKAKKKEWLTLFQTMEDKNDFCWNIIKSVNSDHFKEAKVDCSVRDNEKTTLKIEKIKENLASLFSNCKNLLATKLEAP